MNKKNIKKKQPQLLNYFKNKQLDFNIDFEHQILNEIIPKYIKYKDIIFYNNPKFIKVNHVKLNSENNFLNQYNYNKISCKNSFFIEPIFVKYPNIMETYYKYKNISYEFIDNQEMTDFMVQEQHNILKIKLKYSNDEIGLINTYC